jgi:sodium transport system permease protein
MRWSVIRTIWHREVRDQLRDRRTVFMLVMLPILLYPLLGIATMYMSQLFAGQSLRVGVAGYELLDDPLFPPLLEDGNRRLAANLFQTPQTRDQFHMVLGSAEALEEMLRREEVHAYVLFTPEFAAEVRAGRRVLIDVRLPGGELLQPTRPGGTGPPELPRLRTDSDRGRLAYDRLRPVLREWEREIVKRRMIALDKPENYGQPLIVPLLQEKTEKVWSKIFPFLIVMMSLTGALYPAIDVCAGEKERGTMETLLISPASRSEIVLGKFLTVWVFSAVMALLNLASLALTALVFSSLANQSAAMLMPGGLPAPTITAIAWCTVLLVPLAAFFSAVCLALAVYARSSKEGQYYLMPLMVGTMMLTFLSLAPGMELSAAMSMLPVTGAALLLQGLMNAVTPEQFPWLYLGPVLLPLAAYCYLALHWAIAQFHREEVLFREAERLDLRLWLKRLFRQKEPLPSAGMAMACFLLLLLLKWFVGLRLSGLALLTQTAVMQLAAVAAPAVWMGLLLTASPRLTLRLRVPRFPNGSSASHLLSHLGQNQGAGVMAWLGMAAVLALALHGPMIALVTTVLKRFPGLVEQMEDLKQLAKVLLDPDTPLGIQILVIAGLPALCEELAFRGFILSGLESRLGVRRAVLISSILFAFAHMSAFRFVPTFVLGLILATLATRSGSLLPGLVFHFVHNALVTCVGNLQTDSDAWWARLFSEAGLYGWPAIFAALLVAAPLFLWIYRLPAPSPRDDSKQGE